MDEFDLERPQAGFAWANLLQMHRDGGRPYLEFLRTSSLSCGLYVLPAGGVDAQRPHTEDEVYVVTAGGSLFTAGDETREVRAGDVLYVAAGLPHRFHDISEELRIVVVFAPAEGSGGVEKGHGADRVQEAGSAPEAPSGSPDGAATDA